jgi:Rap1a immunity proteins
VKVIRAVLVAASLSSLVIAATTASAGFDDGNALFERCKTYTSDRATEPFNDGVCAGYIVGATDALDRGSLLCLPDVTKGQIIDVVILWLRDHPEKRHLGASSLIGAALKEKFPCN